MNTRLMVLGLLNQAPKHGYEIQKWLGDSRSDLWADVLPGSISYVLKQMEREKLVEVKSVEQKGYRTKVVYGITKVGKDEFKRLVDESWQTIPKAFPSDFYVLLLFSKSLPKNELRAKLRKMIEGLEQELDLWKQGETVKTELGVVNDWTKVSFENGRDHLEADLKMVRRLLAITKK